MTVQTPEEKAATPGVATPTPPQPNVEDVDTPEQSQEGVESQEEPDEAEASAEKETSQPNGDVIPRYRYNAVRAREQQLAQELEELRARLESQQAQAQQTQAQQPAQQAQQPGDTDVIRQLSEQHAEAILEGDSAKAAEIQAKIIQAAVASKPESNNDEQLIQQAVQQVELTRIAEQLQESFPQLDKDSDSFDEALNARVFKFYEGLVLAGTAPAAALVEAAETVMAAAGATSKSAQQTASTRGLDKKAEAAAGTTPALTPGVGTTGSEATVSAEEIANMTSEEWDALPESTRRKFMGIV